MQATSLKFGFSSMNQYTSSGCTETDERIQYYIIERAFGIAGSVLQTQHGTGDFIYSQFYPMFKPVLEHYRAKYGSSTLPDELKREWYPHILSASESIAQLFCLRAFTLPKQQ